MSLPNTAPQRRKKKPHTLPKLSNSELCMLSPATVIPARGELAAISKRANPAVDPNSPNGAPPPSFDVHNAAPEMAQLEAATPEALVRLSKPVSSKSVDPVTGIARPVCQGTYLQPTSTALATKYPFYKPTLNLSLGEIPTFTDLVHSLSRAETRTRDAITDEADDGMHLMFVEHCKFRSDMANHEARYRRRQRMLAALSVQLEDTIAEEAREREAAYDYIDGLFKAMRKASRRIGDEIAARDRRIAADKRQREERVDALLADREHQIQSALPEYWAKLISATDFLEWWIRDCVDSQERVAWSKLRILERDQRESLASAIRAFRHEFFVSRYRILDEHFFFERGQISEDQERIERHKIRHALNQDRARIRETIVIPKKMAEVEQSEAFLRKSFQVGALNQLIWLMMLGLSGLADLWHNDVVTSRANDEVMELKPLELETYARRYFSSVLSIVTTEARESITTVLPEGFSPTRSKTTVRKANTFATSPKSLTAKDLQQLDLNDDDEGYGEIAESFAPVEPTLAHDPRCWRLQFLECCQRQSIRTRCAEEWERVTDKPLVFDAEETVDDDLDRRNGSGRPLREPNDGEQNPSYDERLSSSQARRINASEKKSRAKIEADASSYADIVVTMEPSGPRMAEAVISPMMSGSGEPTADEELEMLARRELQGSRPTKSPYDDSTSQMPVTEDNLWSDDAIREQQHPQQPSQRNDLSSAATNETSTSVRHLPASQQRPRSVHTSHSVSRPPTQQRPLTDERPREVKSPASTTTN